MHGASWCCRQRATAHHGPTCFIACGPCASSKTWAADSRMSDNDRCLLGGLAGGLPRGRPKGDSFHPRGEMDQPACGREADLPAACAERLKNTKLRLGTLLNNESRSETPQACDFLFHGVVERRERVNTCVNEMWGRAWLPFLFKIGPGFFRTTKNSPPP